MCELLGMTANVPTDICFSFTGLIQRSGITAAHRDGWGITFYEGKGSRTFKDANPGVKSEIAQLVKNYPIKSCQVISHIRKANRGKIALENTHPFQREMWGKNWTFAHNGQLKAVKKRRLQHFHPVGTTDSEHAFCWLLDQLHKKFRRYPTNPDRLNEEIVNFCKSLGRTGVFNVLLGDGTRLYAFCTKNLYWITRKAPFGKARLIDKEVSIDFKKVTTKKDIVTVIASRPLTNNEEWTKMDAQKLYVFEKGVLLNS